MSKRIADILAKRGSRKLLVPFFTVGYPTFKRSLELVRAAVDEGADMVELGMPFSDPMADGPQIQFSSQVALKNDTTLKSVLKAVSDLRQTINVSLILMGYVNPIVAYSEKRFLADAANAGADGLIIPDLPVDEAKSFKSVADSHGLSTIFLVSPTSNKERVEQIDGLSTDFVYAVTVTGVTGSGRKFGRETDDYLKRLKQTLRKPYVAGFGVSSAESARRLTRYADGVVIGSKLIGLILKAKSSREAVSRVAGFLRTIRRAI